MVIAVKLRRLDAIHTVYSGLYYSVTGLIFFGCIAVTFLPKERRPRDNKIATNATSDNAAKDKKIN